jgi:hypothetical protein
VLSHRPTHGARRVCPRVFSEVGGATGIGADSCVSVELGRRSHLPRSSCYPRGIATPNLVLKPPIEDALRTKLASLSVEQLKDIVAEFGMDPGKLVIKWKTADRIIERIVEISMSRFQKRVAFRAET